MHLSLKNRKALSFKEGHYTTLTILSLFFEKNTLIIVFKYL